MQGSRLGFTGKQVIHPSQVPVAQECFAPAPALVTWAEEVIQAFEEHKQKGTVSQLVTMATKKILIHILQGAFVYKNQMIDKPSLLQAENIKAIADTIRDRGNQT